MKLQVQAIGRTTTRLHGAMALVRDGLREAGHLAVRVVVGLSCDAAGKKAMHQCALEVRMADGQVEAVERGQRHRHLGAAVRVAVVQAWAAVLWLRRRLEATLRSLASSGPASMQGPATCLPAAGVARR